MFEEVPYVQNVLLVPLMVTCPPIARISEPQSHHLLIILQPPQPATFSSPFVPPRIKDQQQQQVAPLHAATSTTTVAISRTADTPIYAVPALETTHNQPVLNTATIGSNRSALSHVNKLENNIDLSKDFNPIPSHVNTPVNIDLLTALLRGHPDQSLVSFLIHGFSYGFSIGYNGPLTEGQERNLLSARNNPLAVGEAIRKELSRGHTSGPFDSHPLAHFHCSPLGAVPKKDGSHRIILDLSSPRGSAINEGILPECYTVKYSSFDDAAALVARLGSSSYMSKLDIKHAFRLCPVQPSDWSYLGFCWERRYYFDTRLPFGSRSSPFIFNQFAEALMWILVTVYGVAHLLHYLDDFFYLCTIRELMQIRYGHCYTCIQFTWCPISTRQNNWSSNLDHLLRH